MDMRAAAALVVRTTGAAFSLFLGATDPGGVADVFGFSGDVWTSGMSSLTFATASSSSSNAWIGSSALKLGSRDIGGGVATVVTASSS
jgi:hypothetical protein